ncbi:MAG TPA: PIG-L deacetylase family protein [Chloroflexota bacterium]|nr:PIG-L deacetylase family protein [Chloroflexota bacterium]
MIIDAPAGSLMAVAAHPDDIESWCAGTLARAIDGGATARLLLVTSGDKGSADPLDTATDVARRRERETLEAARCLGIAEVAFLRYPDGEVENTRELRAAMVAYIRRWRPTVLFTHDPEHPYPPYLTHRDHRMVGRAVLDAAYPLARDRLSFPEQAAEGLEPHAVSVVWLFSSARPTAFVDIAAGFERKIAARLAHESQTGDREALRQDWRERAARVGAEAGLGLAEAFVVLRLD